MRAFYKCNHSADTDSPLVRSFCLRPVANGHKSYGRGVVKKREPNTRKDSRRID